MVTSRLQQSAAQRVGTEVSAPEIHHKA
nr:unnamed protein product [Callosobruchus chinensis]